MGEVRGPQTLGLKPGLRSLHRTLKGKAPPDIRGRRFNARQSRCGYCSVIFIALLGAQQVRQLGDVGGDAPWAGTARPAL